MWPSGWPRSSAGARGLAARTPAEVLRLIGRVTLWALLALLLARGAADVLADEPSGTASDRRPVRSAAVWPDEQARAFAAGFARAYLSYSPRRRQRYVRGLGRFMAAELVAGAVPEFVGRGGDQLVEQAVPARSARVDADRAVITVAVGLAGSPGVRYLAVPVARDDHGGLVVADLPSFVAAPAAARPEWEESEPLTGSERAELEDVLARFFRAFLAGDAAGLEYLTPAGERVRAVSPPLELVGVDSIAALPDEEAGDPLVVVTVRARDARSRAVYRLRYRVALVRADRWYVASVNESPKEG
jgi:Conjugative transposon protein TcpC